MAEHSTDRRPTQQSALVVHPHALYDGAAQDKRAPHNRLAEAVGLVEAIDVRVAGAEVLPIRAPRPSTLLGTGQLARLREQIDTGPIDLLVVNGTLSPIQQRNLERDLKTKVIDRTGLILEIFGERAQTREGTLQVELAALTYQRSRLVRSWTHLERQRGGLGFIGGPGESQMEIDRRRIDERIIRIKRELEDVRRTRGLHRDARARVPYPVLVLVGYTNAGKSTLFNRLTGADVVARDQLFATLDPTMRAITLPNNVKVILSDTVGFVADLPTTLVAAFRATLEEVTAADIVLHVRDIAHEESEAQRHDVVEVLGEIGVDEAWIERRVIEVWNKLDLLGPEARAARRNAAERRDDVVLLSAVSGEGIDALADKIAARMNAERRRVTLRVPAANGALLAWLHAHGDVIEESVVEPPAPGDNAADAAPPTDPGAASPMAAGDQAALHLTVTLTPIDLARLSQRDDCPPLTLAESGRSRQRQAPGVAARDSGETPQSGVRQA